MKIAVLPIIFLLNIVFCKLSFAQYKENTDYNIWGSNPKDSIVVYARMANIRQNPNMQAAILDSLPCGSPMIVISKDTLLSQQKGIYAPWAKVSYQLGNSKKTGYVWLGLIALGHYCKDNIHFVWGIEKLTPKANKKEEYYIPFTWFIRLKALDEKGKLLDEKELKLEDVMGIVPGGKLLGDMGLSNTTDIVRIELGGEACGIPTNYYYFAWTGSQLLSLPSKMQVGDAGVFYHGETLLFPKEPGGQANTIIKLIEESVADEEKVDKNGNPIFKTTKSREKYKWDGQKAIKE